MHNNTCRIFKISRTVYYNWLRRFQQFGTIGLLDVSPAKPDMPNKIKPDKEKAILDYVIKFPSHGPKRIANELTRAGIKISDCGVYNVLKRNGLNRKLARLLYMEKALGNVVVTEAYIRETQSNQPEHIHTDHPGHIFSQDTFYVGTIKGIGRIYQQTGVDCYSSFGFAKVYTDKTVRSSVDFLKTKVLPFYRSVGIPLDRVLTDNGKEYTTHWESSSHAYEEFLRQNNIRHTRIKPRTPRTNGFVERLNIRQKMFNAKLVLDGYAEPYTFPPDVKYSNNFKAYAKEAREKKVGLWSINPEKGTTKGDLD